MVGSAANEGPRLQEVGFGSGIDGVEELLHSGGGGRPSRRRRPGSVRKVTRRGCQKSRRSRLGLIYMALYREGED